MNFMIWIWLGAIVLFGVVEAATAGLVSIWFVAGALAALIAVLLGAAGGVRGGVRGGAGADPAAGKKDHRRTVCPHQRGPGAGPGGQGDGDH